MNARHRTIIFIYIYGDHLIIFRPSKSNSKFFKYTIGFYNKHKIDGVYTIVTLQNSVAIDPNPRSYMYNITRYK